MSALNYPEQVWLLEPYDMYQTYQIFETRKAALQAFPHATVSMYDLDILEVVIVDNNEKRHKTRIVPIMLRKEM